MARSDIADLLGFFARQGLGVFCRGFAKYDSVGEMLTDTPPPRQDPLLAKLAHSWPDLCTWMMKKALPRAPRLSRLCDDHRLEISDIFVLSLLGEVDHDHRLTAAVARLQAPRNDLRPEVHLVQGLVRHLFPDADPAGLTSSAHPLCRARAVLMMGDLPGPLRQMAVDEQLWNILLERADLPEGGTILDRREPWLLPERLRSRLPELASLMGKSRLHGPILRGDRRSGGLVAAELASLLDKRAVLLDIDRWNREPVLALCCRYGDLLPVFEPRLGPGERMRLDRPLLTDAEAVFLLGREGNVEHPQLTELDLPPLTPEERRLLVNRVLPGSLSPLDEMVEARLHGPVLKDLVETALLLAERQQRRRPSARDWLSARWTRHADLLGRLATPVRREVGDEALVRPPELARGLDALVRRCRRRQTLWTDLGPTLTAARNSGVRALFTGDSGTGKTLAASWVASRLSAPLYRVDLAGVVNKYIGETEKNLSLLLDEVVELDAILLFDEADSMFGRRTDGSAPGERFANMLTNFLLTRIEDHPGIVILTSNSRSRIDPALFRRLDVILDFPAPAYDERLALWCSHLGERSPDEETCRRLASYCDLPGGHIRNAVLSAAAAADRIDPELLIDALSDEYGKLGRGLPIELQQWRDRLGE